jgi:nitrogen regulatory protein P-II 1
MKNLILVVHANTQQELSDLLRTLKPIQGFTFTHVEGHGVHSDQDSFLSARDKVVGYVPRLRVDILLEDGDVEIILDAVRAGTNGGFDAGVYWCVDVVKSGRL